MNDKTQQYPTEQEREQASEIAMLEGISYHQALNRIMNSQKSLKEWNE